MAKVEFAPRVSADFRTIARCIARDDPVRAITFVEELRQACLDLAHHPRIYPPFPRLGPDARQHAFGKYLILYTVDKREVVTIRVIVHGARDLGSLL